MLSNGPSGTNFNCVHFQLKYHAFLSRKCIWKCDLQDVGHFVQTSMCKKYISIPASHMEIICHLNGYQETVNSLAPGRTEWDSKNIIFNFVLLLGIFRSSNDNALWWMPQDLTDDKSTLVQVMAWCRQATSHYWANVDSVPCRLMVLLGHNELTLNVLLKSNKTFMAIINHAVCSLKLQLLVFRKNISFKFVHFCRPCGTTLDYK